MNVDDLKYYTTYEASADLVWIEDSSNPSLATAYIHLNSLVSDSTRDMFSPAFIVDRSLQRCSTNDNAVEALLDRKEYTRQGFGLSESGPAIAMKLASKISAVNCCMEKTLPLLLNTLSSAELALLLEFRQTPGSSSDVPSCLTLANLLLAATVIHGFDETAYKQYCEKQKQGIKTRGAPSLLTVAGRALTKHAQRDYSFWWNVSTGTQSRINESANQALARIFEDAVWKNLHALPHQELAFEIRNSLGYGVRYIIRSGKVYFRGFLEPHAAQGHAQRWRH